MLKLTKYRVEVKYYIKLL